MDSEGKTSISIIALSSVLLMAIVGTLTYTASHKDEKSGIETDTELSASAKAIRDICKGTDYKEICESSLASANTSDAKKLVQVAFQVAMLNIIQAIENSSLLGEVSMDPMGSQALDICKELLNKAVKDIHHSIDRVRTIDLTRLNHDIGDLKAWIGGAVTFQETCLDGFENIAGDIGEKMKRLLKTPRELTSNGLAMVAGFDDILEHYVPFHGLTTRKLLQAGFPSFVDDTVSSSAHIVEHFLPSHGTTRKFLQTGFPSFLDDTSRRLLTATSSLPKPNVIVAQDGSGQFSTLSEAVKAVPVHNKETFVIFVKAGIYKENVLIPGYAMKVVLIGEGPTKTRITGNKNFKDGTQTYHTATVAVEANNFLARDIGFENSAGPEKHQAVALRVTGDNAVFFNCQIDGYQDTLLAHTYRQFYRDCTIAGTIDFVFGDAEAIFQNCKFIVRKPLPGQACMVTAQGRTDRKGPGAIILQNCQILAEPGLRDITPAVKAYLGRPWKMYSRTIIMNTFIGGFIAPEGWSEFSGDFALDTLYYVEYQNKGPGANNAQRVKWKGVQEITPEIAASFAPGNYFQAGDAWIKEASIPYEPGLLIA